MENKERYNLQCSYVVPNCTPLIVYQSFLWKKPLSLCDKKFLLKPEFIAHGCHHDL